MKVLCATDLLPKSAAAVERAGLLAGSIGADLELLHIVAPQDADGVLEERLQSARAALTSQVPSSIWGAQLTPAVSVRPGTPMRLIPQALEQSKGSLLVLGPHRRRPLQDVLEGTVAEKALASRMCPVLIVRDTPRAEYRRVLLALDTSEASATAVRAAGGLVLMPNVDARVLHVYEPAYAGIPEVHTESLERQAKTAIEAMLARERAHFVYEIVLTYGDPAAAIRRSVDEYKPELVVLGTRGLSRLRRAFVGSVANRILHNVECDTLIVPEGSFVAPRRNGLVGGRRSISTGESVVESHTV